MRTISSLAWRIGTTPSKLTDGSTCTKFLSSCALASLGAELSCDVANMDVASASQPVSRVPERIKCGYQTNYPTQLIAPAQAFLLHVEQRLRERNPQFVLLQAEMSPELMDISMRSGVRVPKNLTTSFPEILTTF